jgi:bifunctional non-homologous end joining protein LigD
VSTPVTAEEVQQCATQRKAQLLTFETSDVLRRVERHGDLFAPLGTA